jgi:radical S-adenosyl methionine domain-containing protein 2
MQHSTLPEAVNYHLNKNCNFRCKGCYATFDEDPSVRGAMLPRNEMFRVVEAIAAAPLPFGKAARKLTFAGGEPTLCPWLPELIAHAKALGLVTMVVTNGSRCTPEYLRSLTPVLDWLTLSIDSLDDKTNRAIGRHDSKGQPLSASAYANILAEASMLGLRTKINTVVNRINCHEDMSGFIADSGIARWKVLQVMPVAGQNDAHIDLLTVSRAEFDAFVTRHQPTVEAAGIRFVPEPVTAIRGSYAMIDPQGRFFDSISGHHTYSRTILSKGVALAFSQVSFDRQLFDERGGSYEFGGDGLVRTSADIRVGASFTNA